MARLFGKKAEKQHSQVLTRQQRREVQVKRCPECFTSLPAEARECYFCHAKVGGVDKHGQAKKRGTWVSYVICLLAWAVFIGYIKWAFFS
ncbi:MAG TPA: hypothetical protein VKO20_03180 [Desulfosalsimonadaceae bacterium]|nr:hypothetical protein [Desulfosalsimonadaceae bacterium]